jgi:hypothetical protein
VNSTVHLGLHNTVTENTGVSEDQGTSNIKIAFAVVLVSRYDKKDKKRLNINIDENV